MYSLHEPVLGACRFHLRGVDDVILVVITQRRWTKRLLWQVKQQISLHRACHRVLVYPKIQGCGHSPYWRLVRRRFSAGIPAKGIKPTKTSPVMANWTLAGHLYST